MLRTCWAALVLVAVATAPAVAEDNTKFPNRKPELRGSTHVIQVEPPEAFTGPTAATISPYIYLNRCIGDCSISAGALNDARTNTSSIPKMGAGCPGYPTCVIADYENADSQKGADAGSETHRTRHPAPDAQGQHGNRRDRDDHHGIDDALDDDRAEDGRPCHALLLTERVAADELAQLVASAVEESGASSPRDMGKVMAVLMPRIKGRADGKQVSALVAQELTKRDLAGHRH